MTKRKKKPSDPLADLRRAAVRAALSRAVCLAGREKDPDKLARLLAVLRGKD